MSTRLSRIPSYRLHKPSGQARVIIKGEHIYLGKYGTPKSWEKYHRIIARQLDGQCVSTPTKLRHDSHQPNLTIDQLMLTYWQFAQGYYVKNEQPTGETDNIRAAHARYVNSMARPKPNSLVQMIWKLYGNAFII